MPSVVAILVLLGPRVTLGTTALVAPLPALVSEAELIATGTVTEVRSFWRAGRIVTRATLSVDQVLAGDTPEHAIAVDSLGGVVDGVGQQVAGAVRLGRGDRVVLFLQRRAEAFVVVEMAQGALFLTGPPGAERLSRRAFGLQLLGDDPEPWPTRLDQLRARVQELRRERQTGGHDARSR